MVTLLLFVIFPAGFCSHTSQANSQVDIGMGAIGATTVGTMRPPCDSELAFQPGRDANAELEVQVEGEDRRVMFKKLRLNQDGMPGCFLSAKRLHTRPSSCSTEAALMSTCMPFIYPGALGFGGLLGATSWLFWPVSFTCVFVYAVNMKAKPRPWCSGAIDTMTTPPISYRQSSGIVFRTPNTTGSTSSH